MTVCPRSLAALLAVLALAGCHKATRDDDQRTASGEVLEGSVSDAMIPYEALTSRPPLAPHVAAGAHDAATADSSGETGAAADAGGEPASAPAPAATPAAPALRY